MSKIALITGASSGLGLEYAKAFAKKGFKIILVARDKTTLQRVSDQLPSESEIIAGDLLKEEDLGLVIDRLKSAEESVDVLINNAGFGLPLEFDENNISDEVNHLRLHNEVPMRLMHAALENMIEKKRGLIINVSSVAAFLPRSTYSAVKQWLVTFSRWANGYYASKGVKVSAVCPGFTHTNFHERMGLPPGEEGIPNWMWLNAKNVVNESIRTAERGKAVCVPSKRYKVIVALLKFIPANLAAKAGQKGRM